MNEQVLDEEVNVDAEALREEVKKKYRAVAENPEQSFHFHTGRPLTVRLGYDKTAVDALPDAAVESFAGVANPFFFRELESGETVVDLGSGAGFDSFIAASQVGHQGRVIGIDMTEQMLTKSRALAADLALDQVEFREGILEDIPVDDAWVDVVISNGVINLCSDKHQVMTEINRILKPGGYLQFADIANGKPVPQAAIENIDLWTA